MIETERLILREMWDGDKKDVYEMLSDKDAARWLGIKPVHNVDEAWAFMDRFLCSPFFKIYAITLKDEDKVIGLVQAFNRWDGNFSLGYCLHSSYRCMGYMTEAVKALVSYFFENFTCLTVRIDVFDGNEASRSVARKCGFFYDGITMDVLTRFGNVEDEEHYSITIGDYEWAHRRQSA